MDKELKMENEENYFEIGNLSIEEALDKCIKVNGLEGTEDTIKRVYKNMDTLKAKFLNAYNLRIRR
jgi:hypothetical protein